MSKVFSCLLGYILCIGTSNLSAQFFQCDSLPYVFRDFRPIQNGVIILMDLEPDQIGLLADYSGVASLRILAEDPLSPWSFIMDSVFNGTFSNPEELIGQGAFVNIGFSPQSNGKIDRGLIRGRLYFMKEENGSLTEIGDPYAVRMKLRRN